MKVGSKILPFLAFIVFLITCRNFNYPGVLHVSGLIATVSLVCFRGLRSTRALLSIFVFSCLLLSYLTRTRDVEYFFDSILYIGYPVLALYLVNLLRSSPSPRANLLVIVALSTLAGQIVTLDHIQHLWNKSAREWNVIMESHESAFYPYGVLAPKIDEQAIRYPELAKNEISFLGSRGSLCNPLITYRLQQLCSEGLKSPPYPIWTTFFLTKNFTYLYENQSLIDEEIHKVLGSFSQGLEPLEVGEFRPRPVCSKNGYMVIDEIHGDDMRIVVAGPESRTVSLPVIDNDGQWVSDPIQASPTQLLQANVPRGLTVLEIAPPTKWLFVVIAFWLPFGVLIVLGIFRLGERMSLARSRTILDKTSDASSILPNFPPPSASHDEIFTEIHYRTNHNEMAKMDSSDRL